MRDPWVCHSAIGKPEWKKRTPFLDLTRNLILALINPSRQMFNWHWSILNNSNNNKPRYVPVEKKRHHHHPVPGQPASLVDWFFTCFQLSGITLRGSRDDATFPGLGVMHLYSILGLEYPRLWDSLCTLLSTARKPVSMLSAGPSCSPFGQKRDQGPRAHMRQ